MAAAPSPFRRAPLTMMRGYDRIAALVHTDGVWPMSKSAPSSRAGQIRPGTETPGRVRECQAHGFGGG